MPNNDVITLSSDSDNDLPDIDFDLDFDIPKPKKTKESVNHNNNNDKKKEAGPGAIINGSNGIIKPKPVKASTSANCKIKLPKVLPSSISLEIRLTDKNAKQAEREAKEADKEQKKLERERKKAEKELDKKVKEAEREVARSERPGNAVKNFTLIVDDDLRETISFSVIQALLGEKEIKCEYVVGPLIQNSIFFQREMLMKSIGDDLQMHKFSKFIEEDQVIIFLEYDKVIKMINIQLKSNENDYDEGVSFTNYVKTLKELVLNKKITLLLYGLDEYYKKMKKAEDREFRDRILNGDKSQSQRKKKNKIDLPNISRLEVESVLIEMQLETNINFRHCKDMHDLFTLLYQYTKAIADAPYKIERQRNGFDWYAFGDTASSVKIESDGKGLKELYIQQLQQFSKLGPQLATAIAAKFPTVRALIKAYERCRTMDEQKNLLKDIDVQITYGPVQTRTRKVGPEISKQIFRFFNTTNPEKALGDTQEF